jgi:hypothetical protein
MMEGKVFDWLRRKHSDMGSKKTCGPDIALPFKSNEAAFEYACQFMQSELAKGRSLPALVLDAAKEHGTAKSVAVDAKGIQTALLMVCSKDNGFRVIATTAASGGHKLVPGDFVAWQAMQYSEQLAEVGTDQRFGWVGLIVGTLRPEWRPNSGWVGGEQYR